MHSCLAVALSGGIDSLVTAALLKEQGQRLIGVHFITGYEAGMAPDGREPGAGFAAAMEQARSAMQPIAEQLDIPIYIIDLCAEFQSKVVDYFIRTYADGKTPNPCLICNPAIKFDLLLNRAKQWGADAIATGHYARIADAPDGRKRLLTGVDPGKDQSYFLARLTETQLASAVFPLGDYTKAQTCRLARRQGLVPIHGEESQDVCFIKEGKYVDFLEARAEFNPEPGPIEEIGGRVIGRHRGLHHYTIGQRRGLNCPSSEPYYVVRIDRQRNCLVVGRKDDLFTAACRVGQINWIAGPPVQPLRVKVKVRYRHQAVAATVTPLDSASEQAQVVFDSPEAAVTPGQGAVFYHGEEVLGGGWIE